MTQATIDRLIINSPYTEPSRHWRYERETRTFSLAEGRRPAGYVVASESSRAFDDPGIFVEIPLVNQIRPRVEGLARGGLSRREQHHQAAVGALDRPGGIRGAALLFLPIGGDRDADLADRSARRRARGHQYPLRRRRVPAPLLQDGHLFYQDELRRRLIITLNMTRVVQHLWEALRFENTERLEPVFDRDHPIRATGDMSTWYTGKPCERTAKVARQLLRLRQRLGGIRCVCAGQPSGGHGVGQERPPGF